MNAQLPVTNNSLSTMLKRSTGLALGIVLTTFCYSISCALMRRYATPDLSASFLHALIVGIASWLALPLYGLSAFAWHRRSGWMRVLLWASLAFVLATSVEYWLSTRWPSFVAEQWLALLHRRVPMALGLWGLMWWWSRQKVAVLTLPINPAVVETENRTDDDSLGRWSLFHALSVSRGNTVMTVTLNEVKVFRACENYVELQLQNGQTVLWRGTMKSLRAQLPTAFVAIHRSYIVRGDAIARVMSTKLVLSDQSSLPIGRQYLNNLDVFRSGHARILREREPCE